MRVRLVRAQERGRRRQLMDAHHYFGFRPMVGESLWYVAACDEQWVALLAWAAAALKCAARDARIGWTSSLKFRRLHVVANNVRFLILPRGPRRNLASQVLARNLERLSADWEREYGHAILLAETFVDRARFRGTCYRAAGWPELGVTRGFGKQAPVMWPMANRSSSWFAHALRACAHHRLHPCACSVWRGPDRRRPLAHANRARTASLPGTALSSRRLASPPAHPEA